MNGPVLAILLTLFVHVVGLVLLLGMAGGDILDVFRSPRRDDDGDWPGWDEPVDDPSPSGEGVPPLPDADPAPVRLREPGRLAPHYRRERRPAREPERVPQRETA